MHLRHAAVLAKAPAADQGNHFPAKFAMGQRPASFLLWTIGHMVAGALWLNTATDYQCQLPEAIQPGERCDGRGSPPTATDRTVSSALSTGSTSSCAWPPDAGVGFVGPWLFSCWAFH